MDLKFQDGVIPAIVQDKESGQVLMLGYMNAEAFELTLRTGNVTFFSRSRGKLWVKGEISGHRLAVREVRVDCDQDALLIEAELGGPGCCHLGYRSCFFRRVTAAGEEVIAEREFDPAAVYGEGDSKKFNV
ncbi:MAG: phosphoribosyl-AMP cyclohydrolase [Terriglobia bacterium]